VHSVFSTRGTTSYCAIESQTIPAMLRLAVLYIGTIYRFGGKEIPNSGRSEDSN